VAARPHHPRPPFTRPLVATAAALVALGVSTVACSSSSDTSSGPDASQLKFGATGTSKTQGDECSDPTGDLQSEVKSAGNLSEPAGIDLVHTAAKVEGDTLHVTFQTAGAVESATNPIFIVQQGDVSSVAALNESFELRAKRDGQSPWQLNLITFANNREKPAQPLNIPVDVQGSTLSYSVPLSMLPRIATIVWQFGSSAGVSDESRIIDDCEPFAQQAPTGSTPGSTGSVPSAPAQNISAQVGQSAKAPDGSTVTVKQVANPANINRTVLVHPIPTDQLAAIEVQVCAGPDAGVDNVGDRRFTVQIADGRSYDVWPPDYATQPQFTAGQTLRAGECTDSAWITYEIPMDATVSQVTYDAGGRNVGPYIVFKN
jgi:hypothetical protein